MFRAMESIRALPRDERGGKLARLAEDQWFERKSPRVHARDLGPVLVGFANAEGGVVVIGVHEGRVEGVRAAGSTRHNAWRQAAADFTVPPVHVNTQALEVVNEAGSPDEVLLLTVDPSDRVHATARDEVYLRLGDETRRLSYAQRQELEYDKGQSAFETTPARHVGWDGMDGTLLAGFVTRLGHEDPKRLLAARGLLTRTGELTVGAVLLFGSAPQAELPQACVRVLRHRGTARGTGRRQQVIVDERIEGPLTAQIPRAQARITELLPTRRALTAEGTFTDVGAVPRDAWLEGLVNAVTHRSYSVMGDHIRVEIFDDRVEIESPGRFPGIVDLSQPEDVTRFARNPRIARVLADLDFGQELGEGIRRMFEEMRLAGLAEPVYRQTSGSVRVTLSADPVDRELEDRLPADGRALVRVIRETERASTGDLVALTGRSRPAVLRSLRALEKAGIIEWVGTSRKDPRAFWRLRIE